jgi:hypothetical protein
MSMKIQFSYPNCYKEQILAVEVACCTYMTLAVFEPVSAKMGVICDTNYYMRFP